jgi:hypothetical protein
MIQTQKRLLLDVAERSEEIAKIAEAGRLGLKPAVKPPG